MKMKKTDYIRILSLLLAASVLMGGCSSRSAQQSEQTSQPVQQETQVEEEPSETSEQDQQQDNGGIQPPLPGQGAFGALRFGGWNGLHRDLSFSRWKWIAACL